MRPLKCGLTENKFTVTGFADGLFEPIGEFTWKGQKMNTKKVMLLASLLFNKDEIEIILKSDDELKDFDEAYKKGELSGEFEIRKALYTAAKSGKVDALIQWNMLKAKVKHAS